MQGVIQGRKFMEICHYCKVDSENIIEDFTDDRLHRSSLTIPLKGRNTEQTICVIG